MNPAVSPYPWGRVPKLSRRDVALEGRVRKALRSAFDVGELPRALAGVLGAEVGIIGRDVSRSSPPRADRSVHVAAVDGSVTLSIEPDSALASVLLARILERPARLVDANAPIDAPTRGALTALVVEAARRCAASSELVALGDAPSGDGICVRATVMLDERPYGVSVWAAPGPNATRAADGHTALADLGDTPISVSIVGAESSATVQEISTLSPGDVWMPGDGWFSPSIALDAKSTLGRAVLAAPSSERGIAIGHSEAGKIVLLGTIVELARDVHDPPASDDSKMGGPEEDLEQAVLDSPVVVRVEVGSVTMAAREWGAVRAGDVIETGLRLGEPVALRIAGKEVARGELVNIEGALGVRITELVAPGRTP